MKKLLRGLILVFILSVGCAVLYSCADKAKYEYDYDYEYDSGYVSRPADEGMNIDGVLDESIWQNKKWYSHYKNGTTLYATAAFTDAGLYIAARVTDNHIYYNNGYAFNRNSNIDITICEPGQSSYDSRIECARWQIDAMNEVYNYTATRVLTGATYQGEINTGNSEGMTVELFVAWEYLGYEQAPDYITILPRYYRVTSYSSTAGGTMIFPGRSNVASTLLYYQFDENGYMFADEEDAVLGNSKAGAAKTNGWNVSKFADDKTVCVEQALDQTIFFREAQSGNYILEATVSAVGQYSAATPSVGLLSAYNEENGYLSALVLNAKDSYVSSDRLAIKTRTITGTNSASFGSILYDDNGKGTADFVSGVRMKVIKNGGTFYYIVNDALIHIEDAPVDLEGEVSCGLYSLDAKAVFSDIKFTDYDEDSEALDDVIGEYAVKVEIADDISGGTVTAAQSAYKKGEAIELNIRSLVGYQFESLSVNGIDITKDVKENIVNGIYTLTEVEEHIKITAKFVLVGVSYEIKGKVSLEGAGAQKVNTVSVTAVKEDDFTQFYTTSPDSNGNYTIYLPEGKYELTYSQEAFSDVSKKITVAGDADLEDVVLQIGELGGSAAGSQSQLHWDYSGMEDGAVTSGTSGNESYILFSGVEVEDYMLTALITDLGKSDANPGAGFVVASQDGSGLAMMIIEDGVRYMPIGKFDHRVNNSNIDISFYVVEEPVRLTVTRVGSVYKMYVNETLVWTIENTDYTGKTAIGFYKFAMTEIQFSEYSYTTDKEEINNYIQSHESVSPEWNIDGATAVTKGGGEMYYLFEEINASKSMIYAVIKAEDSTDANPGAGFVFGTENGKKVAIMLIKNAVRVMEAGDWNSRRNCAEGVWDILSEDVLLRIVRDGFVYYIYVNEELIYTLTDYTVEGNASLGLYKHSKGNIRFKEFSYTDDAKEIGRFIPGGEQSSEYIVSGNVMAEGFELDDFSNAILTIGEQTVTGFKDNTFSIKLQPGSYVLKYTLDSFYAEKKIAVTDGNIEGIILNLIHKVNAEVELTDGTVKGNHNFVYNEDGTIMNTSFENQKSTVIEGIKGDKFAITATFTVMEDASDPLFGFKLFSGKSDDKQFAFFRFEDGYRILCPAVWDSRIVIRAGLSNIKNSKAGSEVTITLVKNADTYLLICEGITTKIQFKEESGAYSVYVNGQKQTSVGKMETFPNYLGGENAAGFIVGSCKTKITYNFTADETEIDKYFNEKTEEFSL